MRLNSNVSLDQILLEGKCEVRIDRRNIEMFESQAIKFSLENILNILNSESPFLTLELRSLDNFRKL